MTYLHLLLEVLIAELAFHAVLEEPGKECAQGVGDSNHDLREAAGQHPQQVVPGRHVLLDAVVVVAKARLQPEIELMSNSTWTPYLMVSMFLYFWCSAHAADQPRKVI